MSSKGFNRYVSSQNVETQVFPWGTIQWLSEPRVTGSDVMATGVVHLVPGKGHDRHHHPGCEEIIYVLDGAGEQFIELGDGSVDARPITKGELVHIPADLYHGTLNTGSGDLVLLVAYEKAGPEAFLRGLPDCRVEAPGSGVAGMCALRLACSTVSCDGFIDNRFNRTFEVLPSLGYKHVEFNCWHPSDLTPRSIADLRRRCGETGLLPAALYGTSFGGIDQHELSKDVCHKIRMIEAAVELGCRRIVATGKRRGTSGGLAAIIAVLREIVPLAEERDVLICLENHANNNLAVIEDYEAVFAAVDSPNVGLCVDTGHFDAANVGLSDVIDRLQGKINHIHVKEAEAVGSAKFVRFGEGVTDNRMVIERMLAAGFDGYASVELAIEDKTNVVADLTVPYELFHRYEG